MKPAIGILLGVILTGLGVYLTFQAWHAAASKNLIEPTSYAGPAALIMGVFRIARSFMIVPLGRISNLALRYVFLGVAVLAGLGNRWLIQQTYPGAVPFRISSPH